MGNELGQYFFLLEIIKKIKKASFIQNRYLCLYLLIQIPKILPNFHRFTNYPEIFFTSVCDYTSKEFKLLRSKHPLNF